MMKTNLYGMFWLSRAALAHIPRGGSIINTASVQGYRPSPHLLDTRWRSRRSSPSPRGWRRCSPERGIRVNAVAPGPVRTLLIPAAMPDVTEFGEQSPPGRVAQPAEMAPAYVFQASPRAGYVTEEIVNATGGTPLP
ncbi:SDR family oxidoreductase [Streptomyces sp. NPDC058646]|uniref:SDR family oxidoreductase n=1 Tax=Streptomyces sp. NPDC058646 TaxID=3346574 RepID=UPI0036590286